MSDENVGDTPDPGLEEISSVLRNPAFAADPLLPKYKVLAERYEKTLRSFMKTLRISDRYQLRMKELNEELDAAMRTDYLTGLMNRRAFFDRVDSERSRAKRHGRPLSIIISDIDEFKLVNDRHGHAAGDAVLRLMASVLLASLRQEDLCVRWGGEEFLVLLPDTDIAGAAAAAEKLRAAVESAVTRFESKEIRVTLSAGAAENRGEEVEDTIRVADEALLQAKRSGRNRSLARRSPG